MDSLLDNGLVLVAVDLVFSLALVPDGFFRGNFSSDSREWNPGIALPTSSMASSSASIASIDSSRRIGVLVGDLDGLRLMDESSSICFSDERLLGSPKSAVTVTSGVAIGSSCC